MHLPEVEGFVSVSYDVLNLNHELNCWSLTRLCLFVVVFLLINKMPFIILTIYNTSIYFTGNFFSWQEVRDHQTFNSVNYSERCLLDDIAFNYLQSYWPFVSWENLSCQIVINNVNVFKMIFYFKKVCTFSHVNSY